jgi:hypothetical protein
MCINNGIEHKCYKFGVTDDIEKRISQYKTGNPNFKLLYYIPLTINMYQLEDYMKNVLKPHGIKNNNETVSFISLLKLKNMISECAIFLIEHICYCNYCKAKFKFKNLDEHQCKNLAKLNYISPK